MAKPFEKTAERTNHWREECNFCAGLAEKKGRVKAMNYDTATFVRYLEMQRDTAAREGYDDSATYLQEIIDDMK